MHVPIIVAVSSLFELRWHLLATSAPSCAISFVVYRGRQHAALHDLLRQKFRVEGCHNLGPVGYIRDLLCLLPSWPHHRVLELAPAYWKQTFEPPATQELLSANVFRRVLLASLA